MANSVTGSAGWGLFIFFVISVKQLTQLFCKQVLAQEPWTLFARGQPPTHKRFVICFATFCVRTLIHADAQYGQVDRQYLYLDPKYKNSECPPQVGRSPFSFFSMIFYPMCLTDFRRSRPECAVRCKGNFYCCYCSYSESDTFFFFASPTQYGNRCMVFVVGGGCYRELDNLKAYGAQTKRDIVYGATELVSPQEFLRQLAA